MAVDFNPEQRAYANTMFVSRAFKVNPEGDGFKLKKHETQPDAPLSPHYMSMREEAVLKGWFPPLCRSLGLAMIANIKDLGKPYDHVLGIPNAGNPIAEVVAKEMGLSQLKMNKVTNDDGTRTIGAIITGDWKPEEKVLGVDDLVTGADTKLEFKAGLDGNRLVLEHLVVGVDREQGGLEKLRAAGISVSAVLTMTQLLDYYLETGKIDQATNSRIRAYIDSEKS